MTSTSTLLGLARAADHYDRALRFHYTTGLLYAAAAIAGTIALLPLGLSDRARLFIAGIGIGLTAGAITLFRWAIRHERAGHRAAADARRHARAETLELLRRETRWN